MFPVWLNGHAVASGYAAPTIRNGLLRDRHTARKTRENAVVTSRMDGDAVLSAHPVPVLRPRLPVLRVGPLGNPLVERLPANARSKE